MFADHLVEVFKARFPSRSWAITTSSDPTRLEARLQHRSGTVVCTLVPFQGLGGTHWEATLGLDFGWRTPRDETSRERERKIASAKAPDPEDALGQAAQAWDLAMDQFRLQPTPCTRPTPQPRVLTQAQIEAHRERLAAQLRDAMAVERVTVACADCGYRAPLAYLYRCYECGMFFCIRCGATHWPDAAAARAAGTKRLEDPCP